MYKGPHSEEGTGMLIGSASTTRRLNEVGALVGGLGALIMFLGVLSNLLAERRSYEGTTRSGHRRERRGDSHLAVHVQVDLTEPAQRPLEPALRDRASLSFRPRQVLRGRRGRNDEEEMARVRRGPLADQLQQMLSSQGLVRHHQV